MAEVVERISALETALMKLAYAQFNTEMELQGLSKKLDVFHKEMKEFKDETRRANREINKRWGEIAKPNWSLLVPDQAPPQDPA